MVFNICLEVLTRAVLETGKLISNNLFTFLILALMVLGISRILKKDPTISYLILTGLPVVVKFLLDISTFGFLGTLFAVLSGGFYALIFAYIVLISPGNIFLKAVAIPGAMILAMIFIVTPLVGLIGAPVFAILMSRFDKLGQLTLIAIGVIILIFPSTLGIASAIATTACKVANVALGGSFSGIGTAVLFLVPLYLLKQKSNQS